MRVDLDLLEELAGHLDHGDYPEDACVARAAVAEVKWLRTKVDALEHEVMTTGGELVIEVGKRMAAERKLEAMERTPNWSWHPPESRFDVETAPG